MKRLGVRLVIGALAGCILISCATKKDKPSARTAATVKAKAKPKASPPPSPTPAPTPEVHYVATVKVEGGESTQADITPNASPSPTPAASPAPKATPAPSPTPKAASGNAFTNAWRKIFPAKAKPAPAPARTQPAESIPSRMWHMIFPRKKAPPAAAPPQWIGTIKLVNEREGYVLIDASNGVAISTDQTLNSVGNETESGVVRVSADRNPPFFIADIVSGKPRAGDRIYSPQP